jgi:hypothetical protein
MGRARTRRRRRRARRARNRRSRAGSPCAITRKEVDDAAGTAETPASLGRGLGALAALTRKLIAHKRDAIAARAKAARLSEDYAKQLEAAAEEVLAADQAASAPRTAARINQGNLDRADGVNLHLLGEIIHTFDAAHELDPSVPRLVPIATRRLLGSDKRKKAAAPTAPPEPAVL